jgi:hypothetical protein
MPTRSNAMADPRASGTRGFWKPLCTGRTAEALETYVFVSSLFETNRFNFDKLVSWLRGHVTHASSSKRTLTDQAGQGTAAVKRSPV